MHCFIFCKRSGDDIFSVQIFRENATLNSIRSIHLFWYGNISHAAVPAPYRFQKYSGRIIQPDFDSSRRKKRSAVWQNTFVQSCHLQQQRFAALYFVVSEYHGKSKEMITASVFRITGADNSIIQQKTCKAKLYRFFGTPEGTRTPDLLVRSGAFSLSYLLIKCEKS